MLSQVNKTDFFSLALIVSTLFTFQLAFKLTDSLYLLWETKLWLLCVGLALCAGFLSLAIMTRRLEREIESAKQALEADFKQQLDKHRRQLRENWEYRLREKEKWAYLKESQSNRRVEQAEKKMVDLQNRLNNLLENKRTKKNKEAEFNNSKAAERARKRNAKEKR